MILEQLRRPEDRTIKIGHNYFQYDKNSGAFPVFSMECNRRVKNKEACVIVVVGEAGVSKSYTAIQIARNIDDRFSAEDIMFTYGDYVKELQNLHHKGLPIVFDEPSYAMGKREWYKQINQALVKTVESQRFLVRPLIIPIINLNLLDKTLRDYLVIFQVHVVAKGRALVYRIRASQGEDKTYRYLVCRLRYLMVDEDKCKKESCLDPCPSFNDCPLLRAAYERKKQAIQMARYEQDEEMAKQKETKEFTLEQLCLMIKPYSEDYNIDGKLDARKIRWSFNERLQMKIGYNKSYEVKTKIEMDSQPQK